MPENIQERMHALIAQHGSALAALATFWQLQEAQQNDEQTDSLENPIPHINVLVEFNEDTSKSAREHRNHLQREHHVRQRIESARPSEMPQK
jgi:hypothetical protein